MPSRPDLHDQGSKSDDLEGLAMMQDVPIDERIGHCDDVPYLVSRVMLASACCEGAGEP